MWKNKLDLLRYLRFKRLFSSDLRCTRKYTLDLPSTLYVLSSRRLYCQKNSVGLSPNIIERSDRFVLIKIFNRRGFKLFYNLKNGSETSQQNTAALDLTIDYIFNMENRALLIVDLPLIKIFSRREVDLNWVWLVEPPLKILATGLRSDCPATTRGPNPTQEDCTGS